MFETESVLFKSVTLLPGVGPSRERDLARLGIFTLYELLMYFPFRYEDRTHRAPILLQDGERLTLRAKVSGTPVLRYKGRKSTLSVPFLTEESFPITAVWFNQSFLKEQMLLGRSAYLTGKYDGKRRTLTVSHYELHVEETVHAGRMVPIYEVKGDLTPKVFRALISAALKKYVHEFPELLPARITARFKLIPFQEALQAVHLPKSEQDIHQSRRRLIFEEFFLFQLRLQAFRLLHRTEQPGVAHPVRGQDLEQFLRLLPFELTGAQKKAAREVITEMRSPTPMNRLLQGDVGSGKTVIAFLAIYAAYCSQHQSALLVPTEILAEQHAAAAKNMLKPLGMEIALLTGSSTAKERDKIFSGLEEGTIHAVIGTHALLEKGVSFHALSLVITDEQHRFGVSQRGLFRQKGYHPDVLFLSATPIPRTLAMTLFGDMDVTVMDELPAGRKPIETVWLSPDQEVQVIEELRRELAKGRQAYVVAPLIEESDKLEDVTDAESLAVRISDLLAGFRVGLMHGRLRSQDKEELMRQFSSGELQALVATTVIEVGVDVPNATFMVIYNADRFGLAQLHQLRGRVGRGQHASKCFLLAYAKTDSGRERMKAMVSSQNGFVLAEKDLELRGPGEFFGLKQSGLPEFKIGNIVEDAAIMRAARQTAASLVSEDDFWLLPEYRSLVDYLRSQQVLSQR
ncbi:MAG: ATP-dependent helicase RecG, partial [Bacilli bacterium]|nr:ATP-dependent helicase RecG [Bacilli bacterium]